VSAKEFGETHFPLQDVCQLLRARGMADNQRFESPSASTPPGGDMAFRSAFVQNE